MNSVQIKVQHRPEGWVGEVEVEQEGRRTQHTVRVSRADARRWAAGEGDADIEDLVRRSFEFLLEREPATSILRSFDLSVIQRYFPEYVQKFRR